MSEAWLARRFCCCAQGMLHPPLEAEKKTVGKEGPKGCAANLRNGGGGIGG